MTRDAHESDDDSTADSDISDILFYDKFGNGPSDDSESNDDEQATFIIIEPDEIYFHGVRDILTTQILPGITAKEEKTEKKRKKLSRHLDKEISIIELQSKPPLSSQLAEIICAQVNIGNIILLNDDGTDNKKRPRPEDTAISGFSTIVNPRQYSAVNELARSILKSAKASNSITARQMDELSTFLFGGTKPVPKKAPSKNKTRLEQKKRDNSLVPQLKEGDQVGIILSERMWNCPHDLVPNILKSLYKDIKWSQTTELSKEEEQERPFYHFSYLLGITTTHLVPIEALGKEFRKKQEENEADISEEELKKTSGTAITPELETQEKVAGFRAKCLTPGIIDHFEFNFPKFEDKLMLDKSQFFFLFATGRARSITATNDSRRLLEAAEYRVVYCISFDSLKTISKEAKRIITSQCLE